MRRGVIGLLSLFSERYWVQGKRMKKKKPKTRKLMTRGDWYVDSPPNWRPASRRIVAAIMVMLPNQSIESSPARMGVRGLRRFRVKKSRTVDIDVIGTARS